MKRTAAVATEQMREDGQNKRTKTLVGVDVQAGTYKPSLSDVQNLLLRTFTTEYGENPKWVCIRGMSLVRTGVVLLIPCLDAQTVRKHATAAPTVARLLQCPGSVSMRSSGEIEHLPSCRGKFSVASRIVQNLLSAKAKPAVTFRKPQPKKPVTTGVVSNGTADGSAFSKPPISTYLATAMERERSEYPSVSSIGPGWVSTRGLGPSAAETIGSPVEKTDTSQDVISARPAVDGLEADGDFTMLFGLDCEMVKTASGYALARVSLVDNQGEMILDELVKPAEDITDYVTEHSGITPELLKDVTTSLSDVQVRLLKVLSERSIVVGHSLENDLKALRLVHQRVVDTALIYPHSRGWPHRHGLAGLVSTHLKRKLDRTAGHDSVADARAALELALLKFRKGPGFGVVSGESVPLGRLLRAARVNLSFADDAHHKQEKMSTLAPSSGSTWHLEACEVRELNNGAPAESAVSCTGSSAPSAREVQILALRDFEALCQKAAAAPQVLGPEAVGDCLAQLDARVRKIVTGLAADDMLMLLTGCGDAHRLRAVEGSTQPGSDASAPAMQGNAEDVEAEGKERRRVRAQFRDAFGVFLAGADVLPLLEAKLVDTRIGVTGKPAPKAAPPKRQMIIYDDI